MIDRPIIPNARRSEQDAVRFLNASNANLAAATPLLPAYFTGIAQESTTHIGYPTSTPGASPASGGAPRHTCDTEEHCDACDPGTSSLTERAALGVRIHDQRAAEVTAKLKIIADATAEVVRMVSPYAPVKDDHPRCTGGQGREGVAEWGRVGTQGELAESRCESVAAPDRGGLCYACAKREYRWRVLNGLPPRAPGFAA